MAAQVKLVSEFVRPDLELSDATIDFGHVPVGQVKRITIKLPGAGVQVWLPAGLVLLPMIRMAG